MHILCYVCGIDSHLECHGVVEVLQFLYSQRFYKIKSNLCETWQKMKALGFLFVCFCLLGYVFCQRLFSQEFCRQYLHLCINRNLKIKNLYPNIGYINKSKITIKITKRKVTVSDYEINYCCTVNMVLHVFNANE